MTAIQVPLSSVNISDLERKYVDDALTSGWLSSTGSYVARFQAALANRLSRSFVAATSSGTSALDLVLRALAIGPGDEVIVPALTFAAPVSAVACVGATPVVADVTRESWTLDPAAVERVRTSRTRLLIAVDVLGHPCDYNALESLGIPILQDAAEAHGARYRGRQMGSFGIASILSFHANKPISTGEGGCVATDDPDLAARIALINNHGMHPDRPYSHPVPGRNARMANLTAAIGLAQVERWDELIAARNRVSSEYDRALADLPVERRPVAEWADEGTWLHTISSPERATILASCREAGVDARAIWPPIPDNEAFSATPHGPYPVAREISARAMWLPTWAGMPESSLLDVVNAVQNGVNAR